MKRFALILIPVAMVLMLVASSACAQTFTGSLTTEDDGLLGTGAWVDEMLLPVGERSQWTPTVLSWEVEKVDNEFWRYTYTLNVYRYEVSHMSVQVSDEFTAADLVQPDGNFLKTSVGMQSASTGSPGMPEAFRAVKFDEAWGTELSVTFLTVREPVWGDFYAKDGVAGSEWNAVWNAGFTSPDLDPAAPPQNGPLFNHLLVPDTNGGHIVPEPGSFLAPGMGMLGILFGRWRLRTRK